MFESVFDQLGELSSVFVTDRGFHGGIGFVIFLVVVAAFYQLPSAWRNSRRMWFVEVLAAPLVVLTAATLISAALEVISPALSPELSQDRVSPLFSVPLILIGARLFNRAIRLFIWQGVLAKMAAVVPRIVWNVLDFLVYVIALYAILSLVFDQPMTGFIVSSGVVIGVLGLSFQPILGDVIAGIGLTIERPFATGDWIELENGVMGEVVNTDWRATQILTWNKTIHVVPNGKLAGATIHNYDRPDKVYGFWFYVTVSRSIPPTLVKRLLLEASLKAPTVLDEPSPSVLIWDTQKQPITYMVFVHCMDYRSSFSAKHEVLQHAWELFTKAGFNFAASPQDIEIRRGDIHEAGELETAVLLKEIPLLEPLSDDERAQMAHDGVIHAYSPGQEIIAEKQPGGSMFIILSGMVDVRRSLADGRVLELARLGTYDYFGEMSLMTGEARSASVYARTECQVLEVGKQVLGPLMTARPELATEIAEIMAERKLRSELMTSETKRTSVTERLKNYSESLTKSIRAFFAS